MRAKKVLSPGVSSKVEEGEMHNCGEQNSPLTSYAVSHNPLTSETLRPGLRLGRTLCLPILSFFPLVNSVAPV